MSETSLTLLIFLPPILAAVAAAVAWRRLSRPGLFFVVGSLALLGLQSVIAPVAVGIFLPTGGGIAQAAAHEGFVNSVQLSAGLVVLGGVPLLWWLARALKRI